MSSEQPCELKRFDVAMQELKSTLGKLTVPVNSGGHSIRVLNERSVSDGGNLWPPWLEILKSF